MTDFLTQHKLELANLLDMDHILSFSDFPLFPNSITCHPEEYTNHKDTNHYNRNYFRYLLTDLLLKIPDLLLTQEDIYLNIPNIIVISIIKIS